MASRETTFETALCVIPPSNLWEQIQQIRSVHDKAYERWMPHINFLFPFARQSSFDKIEETLENVLAEMNPFEIEFDSSSFEYFKQKGSAITFHLRPKSKDEIVQLEKTIEQILIQYVKSTKPFEPHLTLGQTTTSRISDLMIEMKAKWRPIKFLVDRICLISREENPGKPFEVKKEIFLRGRKTEKNVAAPEFVLCQTKIEEKKTKFTFCIVPPDEFSNRLLILFEGTSFVPIKPFRIVLDEFQTMEQIHENFQLRFSQIYKFSLSFGKRSICFNYNDSRLFLKTNEPQLLEPFHLNTSLYDGNLTIGSLDKREVSEVCQLYTDRWTFGTDDFEVSHVHIIDEDGRFRSSFPLKNQCFS